MAVRVTPSNWFHVLPWNRSYPWYQFLVESKVSKLLAAFMRHSKPLVLISSDLRVLHGHPSITLTRKYTEPVAEIADCLPAIVPNLEPALLPDDILDHVDGLLLTGSPSNIEPHHYGHELINPDSLADPQRDATTLPLVSRAIARGVPLLGICRGFQEINVALGGTLHQKVQEVGGLMDHRAREEDPVHEQYAPVHPVHAVPGSWLESLVGAREWHVNSIHQQGIQSLAPGLLAQAHAPDGLIEAYTHESAVGFLLAVQWHPEWQARANPVSVSIFRAFGAACRAYREARLRSLAT